MNCQATFNVFLFLLIVWIVKGCFNVLMSELWLTFHNSNNIKHYIACKNFVWAQNNNVAIKRHQKIILVYQSLSSNYVLK